MLSTVEAAKRIGVSKNTLLRWLDGGLIEAVERDWRGWRVWGDQDVERAKAFQQAYHSKPHRRKRRSSLIRATCAQAAAQSMAGFAQGCFPRPGVSR
jgi:excisionase family DNA binding protein